MIKLSGFPLLAWIFHWTPKEILDLTIKEYLYWIQKGYECLMADMLKIASFFGGDEIESEAFTKQDAERMRGDELQGFPYDVKFLTPAQCDEWIKYSQRLKEMWRRRGIPGDYTRLWDDERKRYCLSNNIVEARAAMNNFLYDCLLKAKEAGYTLTLEDLKELRQIELLTEQYKQTQDPKILERIKEINGRREQRQRLIKMGSIR